MRTVAGYAAGLVGALCLVVFLACAGQWARVLIMGHQLYRHPAALAAHDRFWVTIGALGIAGSCVLLASLMDAEEP